MEFGITFKGFVTPDRARALVKQTEDSGFDYRWFYDNHILWYESYPAMAMYMEHAERLHFGPCVTTPNTRDWSAAASLFDSLALQSNDHLDIGVGCGSSVVRVVGNRYSTLARMEEFIHVVRALMHGYEAWYDDVPNPIQFPWATEYELPVWIAAYGPKALNSVGRVGDGLVLQIAEQSISETEKHAGKRPAGFRSWLAIMLRILLNDTAPAGKIFRHL